MKEVIAKKFEIENKIKGLHVKSNPPAVGASILNITGKLSIEVASHLFSVDSKKVRTEKEKIETFGKPTSERAQKFLEMIKK
jgi:Zn-finger domain-containing protein